ncbi:matrilin-1-like isoform X2 [Clavelina lepadiformis]|uniref:matrilin-1-like isoform X2 n=1 Tax=Clavelina lepadiformis TaxID=159417 RepID=UPI004042E39D
MISFLTFLSLSSLFVSTFHCFDIKEREGTLKLESETPTSFIGYELNIDDEEDHFRLFVGASEKNNPIEKSYKNESSFSGEIESCKLKSSVVEAFDTVAVAHRPSDILSQACSLSGNQPCPPIAYNPGYCFRKKKATQSGKEASYTKECSKTTLDMIFLLDGSFSVGFVHFELIKHWVRSFAREFNIADGSTQIGVVQYSHYDNRLDLNKQRYIVTEINLGQHRDHAQFANTVEGIRLQGFTTYTSHALNKTVLDFKSSPRFSDPTTAKVLILITDGNASDSSLLANSANYLRSLGIKTFAVGVGELVISQLQTIANGKGTNERVYHLPEFESIPEITNQIRSEVLDIASSAAGRSVEDDIWCVMFVKV